MRYLPLMLTLASLALPTLAAALSLEEAVSLTLTNNQRLVQFQATEDQLAAEAETARSPFYPSLDLDYLYTNRHDPPEREEKELAVFSISASYNLFNGFSDLRRFNAARSRTLAAGYRLKAITADLVLAARQAYIARLRARQALETSREGVLLLQRQLQTSQLYYQQGLIARNDLLRVEVELSSARQDQLKTDGDLRLASRRLERLMGIPLANDAQLEDLPPLLENPDTLSAEPRELLRQRSELRYLEQLLAAAEQEHLAARGGLLPRINLTLAHEEYGTSLSPLSGDLDNDDKLLLTARWNLFSGFATSQSMAAADSRKRSLAAELRDTREELFLQLQTALSDLDIARGLQQESRVGVTQAEENYRVTENRYRQQQATTVDLLDARFLLTRARNQEIDARYALHVKAAVLDRVLELEPLR